MQHLLGGEIPLLPTPVTEEAQDWEQLLEGEPQSLVTFLSLLCERTHWSFNNQIPQMSVGVLSSSLS